MVANGPLMVPYATDQAQAVIWTNADPIHWRIYAALGGNGLRKSASTKTVVLLSIALKH